MGWQLLTVREATKAGGAAGVLLDLIAAAVSWDSAANTDGVEFENDGQTILFVSNVDAVKNSTHTFVAVLDKYGRTESLTPVVAATKLGILGPFLPELWNQSTGRIRFVPSEAAEVDITFLAVRVTNPT